MDYLTPWYASNNHQLADELRRELSSVHILANVPVAARAQRQDADEVLFEILDGTGRFAQVHLSYQKEVDPNWPATIIFASEAEWALAMFADHQDFEIE